MLLVGPDDTKLNHWRGRHALPENPLTGVVVDTVEAPAAGTSTEPRRTTGNLSHGSAQRSPGPRLNPELRQRGDGSHHRPLRREAEVVQRGGWSTATAHVLEPPRRPEAHSPASTPTAVDAPAAAPPRRAAAGRHRRKTPAVAVLTPPHPQLHCFVAPPRMTAAFRL